MSSKSVLQIFKILFQTGDINIFALRGVFFRRYVQLKIFFSDENTSAVKFETHFSRKTIGNSRGKVWKENSIIGRSWSSKKLLIMKNYTYNTNGDVPLTIKNVWYF